VKGNVRARGSTLWRHRWQKRVKTYWLSRHEESCVEVATSCRQEVATRNPWQERVNYCVLKHLFLEGVEQPKISPKRPGNALSDALLMSRFQNCAADAAKKKPHTARFFKIALRAVLINWLIRGQSFWEVVFFTAVKRVVTYTFARTCKLQTEDRARYSHTLIF